MASAVAPSLSEEQIADLLGLLDDADSVELKLTVPLADQRSSIEALGFDPLEAQVRLVYFFDTPDLALDRAGVVVRARRIQRRGEDSVVKLRPVVPEQVPKRRRTMPGFGIEVDAMPKDAPRARALLRRAVVPRVDAIVNSIWAATEPYMRRFSRTRQPGPGPRW